MKFVSYIFFLSIILFAYSCGNTSTTKEGEKTETKSDSTDNNADSDKTLAKLESEWRLDSINNEKTPIELNLIFNPDGKFSKVTAGGTVKGSYSREGRKIVLKSEESEDNWDILVLTDSVLVVFDNHEKNKAEYKFKK
jgi:hypothetical protein